MKEKRINFKINGENKTIVISKDIVNTLLGLIFIISSAILLGIFEMFKIGWDWSLLLNEEFWIGYFIKLAMNYLAFFGAYIIRRGRNLKSPRVLIPREVLRHNKTLISNNFKTSDCESWTKNVYSYGRKLELYKKKLQEKNSKLNVVEPTEPKCEYKLNKFQKCFKFLWTIKFKFLKTIYRYRKWKYNRHKKKREYFEEQLRNCEIHKEVINLYRQRKVKEAKELLDSIKHDDFRLFYPTFKELTYNKLFNVCIEITDGDKETFDYNERSTIVQKVIKSIGIGCISLAIMTSVGLDIKQVSILSLVYIAMNLILMCWFIFNGTRTADKFVFGNVMRADNNRIKVCNLYRDDCLANGDEWAKEFKDNKDIDNMMEDKVKE